MVTTSHGVLPLVVFADSYRAEYYCYINIGCNSEELGIVWNWPIRLYGGVKDAVTCIGCHRSCCRVRAGACRQSIRGKRQLELSRPPAQLSTTSRETSATPA